MTVVVEQTLLTSDSQPPVKNEQIQEQAPSPATDKAHEEAGEAQGDASANENNDSHPPYPGDDPTKAPEGTEWIGAPGSKPGDSNGNYHNPETGESFHPDLNHPSGGNVRGPHWDYKDMSGIWFRLYPDGSMEPK